MKQKLIYFIPRFIPGVQKPVLILQLVLIAFLMSAFQINANDLGKGNKKVNTKPDSGPDAKTMVAENNSLRISAELQQQITVTGTVKDENGDPMPGVNVQVEGTSTGSMTDVNGKFSINAPRSDAVLILSFVGYYDMRVLLAGRTTIDVSMEPSIENLDEVIVVGYGTQRKKDVTSAITVVDVQDIAKAPVANVANALEGVSPGIEVQSNQARPGALPTIRIRGVGSVNTTDPLYVVDGIPMNEAYVNMQDVESIQVLKDAASCAIYGSRGANGVIIITTKGGKRGAPKVSYNGYYGWESPWKTIDLLNINQWAHMVVENNTAGGTTPPPLATDIVTHETDHNYALYDGTVTDWQKEIFQTGAIKENNLAISGGTEAGNYYFSVNQFGQDGIIIDTKYKRFSVRMNSNWESKKFKFGENLSFFYTQNEAEDSNGGRSTIEETIKITPNIPVKNPLVLGGYSGYDATLVGHDASNPVGSLMRATNMNYGKRFIGNVYGEYEIVQGLAFRTTFGLTSYESQNRNFVLKTDMQPKNYANTTLSESSSWTYNWVWENMLNYHRVFGNHDLTAMGAFTSEYSKFHSMGGSGITIQTETNDILSKTETGFAVNGNESENSRISMLGRIMYTYMGKYMLTANFRRDGSSKFGPGNKWGNFPSASVAWRLSDESFMNVINQISNLKLRVSYGVVGNDGPVGPYTYLSGLSSGLDYVFNNTKYSGVSVTGFNNPDLTWETVRQFDVGLDLGLFKGLIEATVDYFNKRTVDMIVGVPLPPSSGSSGNINKNVGTILNKGLEFSATVRQNFGDFDFSISGNLTTLHNEVLDLGEGSPWDAGSTEPGSCTRIEAGHQIGAFYGYRMLGVFPDQGSIDAYTLNGTLIQPNAKPGDIKWADLDNSGSITSADREFIGNPIPTLTYSLTGNFSYKGFDLSLFFQGVHGNDIFAELVMWTEGMHNNFNCGTAALDRWTPTNTITNVPRAVRNDPNHNITYVSDRYLKSGDYLRLKNASLGYTLPRTVTDFVKISNLRIYLTGRNLLTFTKYPFYDPEIGSFAIGTGGSGNTSRGIDNGYYPQARTFIMGIQVDF
jgi:TonB-linked SusC/RagA family outer membrane protein